ncbi:MAG: DUF1080 domain-containing protein [Actinomycetota bacterium]|nr:DUF1080 domain-containing protein [Actinomycetota bacterium]
MRLRGWSKNSALLVAVTSVAVLGSGTGAQAGSGVTDNFESLPVSTGWADGSTHGQWKARFDGYGSVGVERAGSKVLSLKPKASDTAGETHAALVTSRSSFGDVEFAVKAKTVRQLRDPRPNPWESAWVIWHYKDNTHFYYLALKPNGWELGKADPNYQGAQRFLATGSSMQFPVGKWANVRVRQVGRKISVWANGELLTTFTDRERPYTSGNLGLYNEDSKTYFDDVRATSL